MLFLERKAGSEGTDMEIKETPLVRMHEKLKARMIEFAGFRMPVSYTSIIDEHQAVRERVGLFDVSHMGEFLFEGKGAEDFVNELVTNDCARLKPGAVLYTVMCRNDGTVVDDLLVYKLKSAGTQRMFMVVNAANIEKDFAHISRYVPHNVVFKNVSDNYALLALQGPVSIEVLKNCPIFSSISGDLEKMPYYHIIEFNKDGQGLMVSRTGYTGERGYEIFVPPEAAENTWEELMRAGSRFGIRPVGLAARDTLRFEASFCLYGHELDDTTSPLESGLKWVVKLGKEHFIGKDVLLSEKEKGSRKKLIGLELEGRNIARQDFVVIKDDKKVGKVTSGTFSPTLKKSLCMAHVANEPGAAPGKYSIEVRGRMVAARETPLPFYKSRANA
jgi:aminomethyltransferase